MTTLDLTVWEFVRIMVALEDEGEDCPFYVARADVWDAVDGELGRLAEHDADAFAEMMMEHQVTLEDVTVEESKDIVRGVEIALEAVKGAEGEDETQAAGLSYEKKELKALLKKLRRSGGGKGNAKKGGAKAR